MKPIRFYNRYSRKIETELVAGDAGLKWTYGTALGKFVLWALLRHVFLSKMFGLLTCLSISKKWIPGFIEKYEMQMSEFEVPEGGYPTFDAFFTRKLIEDIRPIYRLSDHVVFPADGRHLLFEKMDEVEDFYIKKQKIDLLKLLGDEQLAERYKDGAMLVSRLCPVDYHRFHFPVSGRVTLSKKISGSLYSVNPAAMQLVSGIFWENARELTEIQTVACEKVMIIEIGATFVGEIVQTFDAEKEFEKGAEKGYFTFGGSTVVTLFQKGAIDFSEDLLAYSATGVEIYARMGDRLGQIND